MEASNENDDVATPRKLISRPLNGLIKAVISRNLARLREFVEGGHSVRCSLSSGSISGNVSGNRLLHVAALFWTDEHTQILEYLLSLDEVEKDARNSKGETPLLLFTKKKLKTPAEMLITAGADVTIADQDEFTPLHYSVRYNREVSHQLILAGADINHKGNNSETPLHHAIEPLGDLEIVCMLLYYGADTSIETTDHYVTPFMLSLGSWKTDIALQLFEYVTDFNLTTKDKWSTLLLAVRSDFPRIIDMCQRGADINYDEHPDLNIFNLGIIPKPEVFRYLWPRFDWNHWPESAYYILVYIIRDFSLSNEEIVEILQILFINDDLEKITFLMGHFPSAPPIYLVVENLNNAEESKDMVHTLVACMLMCNAVVHEFDLDVVYEHYGYCEAFKLLLYMDIQTRGDFEKFNVFPSLIYKMPWHHEFESLILRTYIIYNDDSGISAACLDLVDFERMFDHLLCPNLKRTVKNYCLEALHHREDRLVRCMLNYLSDIPGVPLLKELARNKSRDFICDRFRIKTCCMFYTILQRLDLDIRIKKLIAFEKPLYKNDFEENNSELKQHLEIRRAIRMCLIV